MVGIPGAWGKKAESLDASSSSGHPQPLPQDEEPLSWKGKFPPSVPSSGSPSCPCREPACTDHFYSHLSCSLPHIWTELHVHGVRGHSKIISGQHSRHMSLWSGKWLVPGGGKEIPVTDKLLMRPPLPASEHQASPIILTTTLTFPQSS